MISDISTVFRTILLASFTSILGCQEERDWGPETETSIIIHNPGAGSSQDDWNSPDMIKFKDEVHSGELPKTNVLDLRFRNIDGHIVQLRSLLQPGKKMVLIVMRGFAGEVCKFCTTQTSRLISNYSKFTDRDTEVVIVYPVPSSDDASRLQELQMGAAAQLHVPNLQIPMPMLLDVNLEAVKQLGIEKNLAKPSTYIFDSAGELRFAYVGSHLADRPSIQALLDEIDKIQ